MTVLIVRSTARYEGVNSVCPVRMRDGHKTRFINKKNVTDEKIRFNYDAHN